MAEPSGHDVIRACESTNFREITIASLVRLSLYVLLKLELLQCSTKWRYLRAVLQYTVFYEVGRSGEDLTVISATA